MLRLLLKKCFKYEYLARNYSTFKLTSDVIDSIKSILGTKNFSLSESIRYHYSKDESLNEYIWQKFFSVKIKKEP